MKDFEDLNSEYNSKYKEIENIFRPNKPSQKQLSSTGNEIDIPSFILFILNNNLEPNFYLEEKGGLLRNYSISIIIDNSMSCLNELSFNHTINTIKVLLFGLSKIDIPSFDLIITGKENPIILTTKKGL